MKKSLFWLVISSFLFIGYSTTFADTKADEQAYRENAKSINEIRSKSENVKQKQITFPGTHPPNAIFDTWSRGYGSSTDTFNVYVWRESRYVWIEIEPLSGNPFICSSSFAIISGGIQYDTIRLENVSGSSQCGDVYVASIFWFTQYSYYDNPADLNKAFTIFYDGGENTYTLDIAANPVSSTTPADNATDVDIHTTITAIFSKAMDSSTITTDTFLVTGSGNIAGTVAYSDTTATFTPAANLDYNNTYTATITTGATDLAGNALQANYTWSFTTPSESGDSGCFIATAAYGSLMEPIKSAKDSSFFSR